MSNKTIDEMIAVMQAFKEGKQIEYYHQDVWHLMRNPGWNWNQWDYRVKELSKPSIDWSHVNDNFNFLLKQMNGGYRLFPEPPLKRSTFWESTCNTIATIDATAFTSFKPGDCDWKDSLVERPK